MPIAVERRLWLSPRRTRAWVRALGRSNGSDVGIGAKDSVSSGGFKMGGSYICQASLRHVPVSLYH